MTWTQTKAWLGVQPVSGRVEQLTAALGSILSLVLISVLSYSLLGSRGGAAIVPSMGAATVLLFAVPQGPLSQPWALFAGNLLSAAVGVAMSLLIDDRVIASGLAVGLAVAVMHIGRCIHPPGGATALAAVIGGDAVYELGFWFVVAPVLLNCVIIFVVACIFNNCFPWRRYPSAAFRFKPSPQTNAAEISRQHIEQALKNTGAVVDISANQLTQIFQEAEKIRQQSSLLQFDFELGGVYSNNKPGAEWAIRKIVDHANHPDPNKELIIYKVLDGAQKNTSGSCTRTEFADWAKLKLQPAKK